MREWQLPVVSLHVAELSHNIARNVPTELVMPFGRITTSASTLSSANLEIVTDGGRVLVYTLDATHERVSRAAWP